MAASSRSSATVILNFSVLRGGRVLGVLWVYCILYDSRSLYLPFLSNTLPLFSEICKRCARFIMKCLFFSSSLVRHVVLNSVNVGRFNSYIYRNVRVICTNFGCTRIYVGQFIF